MNKGKRRLLIGRYAHSTSAGERWGDFWGGGEEESRKKRFSWLVHTYTSVY